jgi:trk system potassium uptake protein
MVNFKIIINILGLLLLIEGICMFLGLPITLIYDQEPVSLEIAFSSIITFVTGGTMYLITRKAKKSMGKTEGYLIVSLSWVCFSLFGAIPFLVSGEIPTYTDAFFETISGFTTTGASILNDIESMSYGLLFWRSMTQWLGGMGIIVMSLAILPILGIGGMQLFVAEVPGPTPDKLHPRITDTAKRLWAIYIIFTGAEALLLWAGDMNLFEAINHSFTTMATGGYSTRQASITDFSPYVQYIITIFMFFAGTNFTLSYFAMHLKFKKVWKNEEFRYYLFFVVVFITIITGTLFVNADNHNLVAFENSFRESAFQVVSIITTTGYATADYTMWAPMAMILIFMLMFIGGSAGSTGGGPKIMRIQLLLKNSLLELKRLKHPNALIPIRFNKKAVPPEVVTNILAFVTIYMLIFAFGTVVMSALGYNLETASGSVIACLGNIGPGIGNVGPAFNFYDISTAGKWFLSFLMLIGRLELFTVLIILNPDFWRR